MQKGNKVQPINWTEKEKPIHGIVLGFSETVVDVCWVFVNRVYKIEMDIPQECLEQTYT